MQAVLLAAGESSRFWPLSYKKHKSQTKILGQSLIWRTIEELKSRNISDIIIVHGRGSALKEELGDGSARGVKISYVLQETANGTGDAAYRARHLINDYFFVLHPHKIGTADIMDSMLEKFRKTQAEVVLVGAKTENPADFGMLKFSGDTVLEIRENPVSDFPSMIKSSGIYFVSPNFFNYYQKVARREEDLIDAFNLMLKDRKGEFVLADKEPMSLKYPWDLFKTAKEIFDSNDFKHYIAPSVKMGHNVTIIPPARIGEGTEIGANTLICGPVFIGKECKIGVSNVIREYSAMEDNVHTGAFAEIKNSLISDGVHIHSGFFGDSIIGRDCRFGAGFVGANRRLDRNSIKVSVKDKKIDSGLTYLGAIIGDGAKFGIHVSVMPGVLMGPNCVVGPHSVVSGNIGEGESYYTKFEEIIRKPLVI